MGVASKFKAERCAFSSHRYTRQSVRTYVHIMLLDVRTFIRVEEKS